MARRVCADDDGAADGRGGGDAFVGGDAEADAEVGDDGAVVGDSGERVEPAAEVDPECVDGQYDEPLPSPEADLDGLLAAYEPGDVKAWIASVLDARYPIGAYLVRGGLMHTDIGDCVDIFLAPNDDPDAIIAQLSTLVHECGHFLDLGESTFTEATDVFNDEIRFACAEGDTTDRGGRTFARSRINGDAFAALRPACRGGFDCDSYGGVYLDGDPDDEQFQGGDQGFSSLLEETVQYVNSLATGYAFADRFGGSVSERDGILTFLWYLGRYLKLAREDYPDAYELLTGDTCWREAILTTWGRAFRYLELTAGDDRLGIDDDAILALVRDPRILGEIQRVRDAQGCD